MNEILSQPIRTIRHVEQRRAPLLEKLGIETVGDLLLHLPSRYLDMSQVARIGDQFEGDLTCSGTITSVRIKRPRPKLRITEVALTDETGTVFGVWFNQPWVATTLREGQSCTFAGTMTYERGMRQMNAPFIQPLTDDDTAVSGTIKAIYPTTEGLPQGWLRRIIDEALVMADGLVEIIPESIRASHRMRTYLQALRDVHHPLSIEDAHAARNRLVYQEMFELSLLNEMRRYQDTQGTEGYAHRLSDGLVEEMQRLLEVTFTEEQLSAIEDIAGDMGCPHPMQRLLLGDVGTGKTFVATVALCIAATSDMQAAVMAPTEVLAKQYAERIGPFLDAREVSWMLLTSSLTSKQRAEALSAIAAGEVDVVFGTHALIQPDVVFKNLTLAVIDEQHRFGVAQRSMLRQKAHCAPDTLSMTATPIPRSLALTLFGDLDISTIRKRPIKGAGVTTSMRSTSQVVDVHEEVRAALDRGQQAFIVCALIDESTVLEVHAATELASSLAVNEYRDYRVGLIHGNMRPSERDDVMRRFREGAIDVLVSTTVIEVGLDIHNATQMVVYNAERFGLAQLHQLRGRVGRGAIPGRMWLISDGRSAGAQQRLEALCAIDDGFKLADIDLALRGAGDILGTRQHGSASFRVTDVVGDLAIIELAKRDAKSLLAGDRQLEKTEHELLKSRLELLREGYETWVGAG